MEKQVYDKIPVTKKEQQCLSEKQKREWQRNEFRKQFIEQQKEKREQ